MIKTGDIYQLDYSGGHKISSSEGYTVGIANGFTMNTVTLDHTITWGDPGSVVNIDRYNGEVIERCAYCGIKSGKDDKYCDGCGAPL